MIVRGIVAVVLTLGCLASSSAASTSLTPGQWYQIQGIWTATGSRNTLKLGGDRSSSIADYTGSLVLSGSSRPNAGFRAEALIFSDTSTGAIGRAVWTDQRGDQVFSELSAQNAATGGKITGKFVGGTGRYAGASGTYEFTWRFIIQSDEGTVQGQTTDLTGRIRFGSTAAGTNGAGRS
ncbi:MAG: hypothetical protein JO219_04385 [Candidatus Eremiobacteraeota bacterium]|nr:hypothetical protein [Candidatus Eremiobacteraeota bacterium]